MGIRYGFLSNVSAWLYQNWWQCNVTNSEFFQKIGQDMAFYFKALRFLSDNMLTHEEGEKS